jgi:hypothetical protein
MENWLFMKFNFMAAILLFRFKIQFLFSNNLSKSREFSQFSLALSRSHARLSVFTSARFPTTNAEHLLRFGSLFCIGERG